MSKVCARTDFTEYEFGHFRMLLDSGKLSLASLVVQRLPPEGSGPLQEPFVTLPVKIIELLHYTTSLLHVMISLLHGKFEHTKCKPDVNQLMHFHVPQFPGSTPEMFVQ